MSKRNPDGSYTIPKEQLKEFAKEIDYKKLIKACLTGPRQEKSITRQDYKSFWKKDIKEIF